MSGLMVKVALYGLIRVEFEWLGAPPRWLGFALLAVGALSALGGVLWALVQHELKRLLAYSTIENVGIVAPRSARRSCWRRRPVWAALAFAAALLHIANHAVFKVLLFLGAGAIERARQRSTSTGSAGCCAGCRGRARVRCRLPGDRRGAAAQRLRVGVADAAVARAPGLRRAARVRLAGAAALAGLAATAALALLCFVKVAGLVLLGRAARAASRPRSSAPLEHARGARGRSPRCASCSALVPGRCSCPAGRRSRPARRAPPARPGLDLPGTGGLPAPALARRPRRR